MNKFRSSVSWSSVLALAVFGTSLALVVTSCGRATTPVAPTSSGAQALIEIEPTPTPTPEATPTPTPTPPTGTTCSPGYWKNHLDVWYSADPTAPICAGYPYGGGCQQILSDLEAKGGAGSGQPLRDRAADYLNGLGIGYCPGDTY